MATGDKRISELTQIVNAPANGVLPIDVPGNAETNGITVDNLARTMKCMQRDTLYGNTGNDSFYSKISKMEVTGEGCENSLTMLINGGNYYVSPASESLVSITVHRDTVYAAKNSLIGDLEIGYVYQGNILEVWVKRVQFSHFINVCVLSDKRNDVLDSGVDSVEPPYGYTNI